MHLRANQAQNQLVIGFVQSWRVHNIRSLDRIHQVQYSDACGLHQRQVRDYVELGNLAALHGNCAYPRYAIQRRLQLVGGNLPQLRLWNGVGGQAVAEDWKRREGEPIGGHFHCRGQRLLHLAQRSIHQLQFLVHVLVPVEEETDLGLPPAGGGTYGKKSRHGVHRVFNGLGNGDLHLLERHDAVVNADDDAWKIRLWKNRDGHLESKVDARQGEHCGEKEDGARGPGQPETRMGFVRVGLFVRHQSAPPPLPAAGASSSAGPTLTFMPSSNPYAPPVMTRSLAPSPPVTCTSSASAMPRVTGLRCAAPSSPTTITDLLPSCAVRIEAAGTFHAFATDLPVMETLTGVPTLSLPALLSILSQTSTVVLPGSSAGLMSETFPATGSASPGTWTDASSSTFICWARLCAMCVFASSVDVSITVISGAPAAAVSPANSGRSVTTPAIGLLISE